jgi:hypothetical protein
LSGYLKIDNGIDLDNGKKVKAFTPDATISSVDTGFYLVQNISSPTGLTDEYPVTGKALLAKFNRTSQGESLLFYYPIGDLTHYYVRTPVSDWTEFKSAIDYTITNGLTKVSNTISLGGAYTSITLTGDTGSSVFEIIDSLTINLDAVNVNITGDTSITGSLTSVGNFSFSNGT